MVFRIRYRQRCDGREGEAVVEANTPTEAMVKFRHAHGQTRGSADNITSVSSNGDVEQGQSWEGEET